MTTIKEHTKEEQPSNLYCVSSSALVYGKSCEKWCGSEHCLRSEQPKEEQMIKPTQPYFKGKGEHSVNELEKMCQQYKDYISHINSQPKEEVDVWDEAANKYFNSDGCNNDANELLRFFKQHYTLIKKQ